MAWEELGEIGGVRVGMGGPLAAFCSWWLVLFVCDKGGKNIPVLFVALRINDRGAILD